jgi:hypothetical protein
MTIQQRIFEDDELPLAIIPFHLEQWKGALKALANTTSDSRRQVGETQWQLGELLLYGQKQGKLKEKAFKKNALQATGYKNWGSLKNIMWVVSRFPEARRRDGRNGTTALSFVHHAEVVKFDEATQEKLLDMAVTVGVRPGGSWPRTELVKYIKDEQKAGRLPQTGNQKGNGSPTEATKTLKIEISEKQFDSLAKLAKAKWDTRDAAKMFRWMASQYAKEHEEELKSLLVTPKTPLP